MFRPRPGRAVNDMTRSFLFAAGITVLHLGSPLPAAAVGEEWGGPLQPAPAGPQTATGELAGVVTGRDGAPVGDVLVSLVGPGGSSLAVSDAAGRFRFDALPAGRYLMRTHAAGGDRRFVQVTPGEARFEPLQIGESAASRPDLRLAGGAFGFGPLAQAPADNAAAPFPTEPGAPATDAAPAADAADADPQAAAGEPKPGVRMWRLRRARRSVLKDRLPGASLVQRGGLRAPGSDAAGEVSGRWTAAAGGPPLAGLPGLPISGEVQLLTRATLAGPSFFWPSDTWPGQVAYVSVAPSDAADWALRGTVDMTTGETSSWAIDGWYAAAPRADHDLQVAVSYSRQAYAAAADLRLDGARSVEAGVPSREVGRIDAVDTWTVSPALEIGYGVELARYGYLEDGQLLSPRASVTMSPLEGTRLRAGLSRKATAPGGEQFLPPLDGVWLPPERTYSSLSGLENLHAEQVGHVELGLERDLGEHAVVGVRRFRQRVDGQLLAMFAPGVHAPPGALPASGRHYYLTAAGGVDVEGWGLTFEHELEDRLRGAIDYRIVRSAWTAPASGGLTEPTAAWVRRGPERFHDVTATLEAEIPETATRIATRCRIGTGFAGPGPDGMTSGLDARFDVQVTQALPYAPFEGSSWELLVALRSLFHEPTPGASVYDELLVVDPPRQLVGGLVVHF